MIETFLNTDESSWLAAAGRSFSTSAANDSQGPGLSKPVKLLLLLMFGRIW